MEKIFIEGPQYLEVKAIFNIGKSRMDPTYGFLMTFYKVPKWF